MNDKIETGDAAFPVSTIDNHTNEGMSLRDYFAAKAMHGIVSGFYSMDKAHGWSNQEIATEAFSLADAMIAERNKT